MSKHWPKEDGEKDPHIRLQGTVTQVLQGSRLMVSLPNGSQVLAYISGQVRKRFVRIRIGDIVNLEFSPYNLESGRITQVPCAGPT